MSGEGRGPEFVWDTLEVAGPHERLHAFLAAASGPGFIDWRFDSYSVYEQIYFGVMAAGAPSRVAAERLARKLRTRFSEAHEHLRRAAEIDPHRVPLDLNALIPIPQSVCRRGFVPDGQAWIAAHWGVAWPLRDVSLAMEHRRRGNHLALVAVFRFVSEDWSPWIALAQRREAWPELRFRLAPSYLEAVATDRRGWHVRREQRRSPGKALIHRRAVDVRVEAAPQAWP